MIMGENGIFSKAQNAKTQTNVKSAIEEIRLAILEAETRVRTEEGKNAELKDLIKELENKADTYLIKLSDGREFASLDTSGIGVLDITDETPAIKITNLSTYKIEVSVSKDFRIVCDGIEVAVTPTTPGGDDQTATGAMIIEKGQTTARPITTADYGRKVSYLNNDGTGQMAGRTWRLFYVEDSSNIFGDGKGTIYLKADWLSKDFTSSASYTAETTLIRKLNPDWATYRGTSEDSWTNGEKSAARLCDTSIWEPTYRSTNTAYSEKINWVVGAPSAEMYMKSYSQKVSGASNYGAKYFSNEYNKYGYKFSTDERGFVDYMDKNSISSAEANGMYLPWEGKKDGDGAYCYTWLSSPYFSKEGNNLVCNVSGYDSRIGCDYYAATEGSMPIVSLKSDVILQEID